jgi:hypothetical protein
VSTLGSARRFYLAKRHAAAELGDEGLELVWRGKQEAESATALPSDFPHLSTLTPLGYTAREDLAGADECELTDLGLTLSQATEVIAAFAAL